METEKLYYNDGKLSAFTATVLECREAKDGWDVVLDRTAFYPEGGGQPCDRGTLERLEVLDVQEQKNCILHRLEQPLLPGTEVHWCDSPALWPGQRGFPHGKREHVY